VGELRPLHAGGAHEVSKAHAAAYLQVGCKSVRQRTYRVVSTNNRPGARKGARLRAEPEIAKSPSGSSAGFRALTRIRASQLRFALAILVCTTAPS